MFVALGEGKYSSNLLSRFESVEIHGRNIDELRRLTTFLYPVNVALRTCLSEQLCVSVTGAPEQSTMVYYY